MLSKEEQQYQLGLKYFRGEGVAKDLKKAVEIFHEIAKKGIFSKGHAGAQCMLGKCYMDGLGVLQDSKKAFEFCLESSNQKFAEGQWNLAKCYEEGIGVSKDRKKAFEFYQLAAAQKFLDGQYSLGRCYRYGIGTSSSFLKAKEYLKLASDRNHALASWELAFCWRAESLRQKNEQCITLEKLYGENAIKAIHLAARQVCHKEADPDLQFKLGLLYLNGKYSHAYTITVPTDKKKGAELLQFAANQGHIGAHRQLMICYANGLGVFQDHKRAAEYFLVKAKEGDALSQSYLMYYFQNGLGVPKDRKKSEEYYQLLIKQWNAGEIQSSAGVKCIVEFDPKEFKKSAELFKIASAKGNGIAQLYLGLFYENGIEVNENVDEAIKLYKQAIGQGVSQAKIYLGLCYQRGFGGVTIDPKTIAELLREGISDDRVESDRILADKGDPLIQYDMGLYYEYGLGVTKDLTRAKEFYQKSFDNGNLIAKKALQRLVGQNLAPVASQSVRNPARPPAPPLPPIPVSAKSIPLPKPPSKPDYKEGKESRELQITTSLKIDYGTLVFANKLGEGGFGTVHKGSWRHNEVAIKQLLTNDVSETTSKEFETEVQIMARLRSPNIISLYGYCLSPKYCIVMEYMPKGSLFSVLRSNQPLDWNIRIKIATDMACGLAFLHQEKILHRDIKSLNVLLDEQYKAKLTDFGLSKIKGETRTLSAKNDSAGTLAWMAPELFEAEPYTQKSDVYSLGITFWELASRKIPFISAPNPNLIPVWVGKGKRETIPADCPKKLATLIQACWEADPAKRPDSETVVAFLKKEQQEDFQTFLPSFAASRHPSVGFSQALVGNLASANVNLNGNTNANKNTNVNANVNLSSFNAAIVGNLGSGK